MKRKILFSLVVAVIAIGAAWNMNFGSQTNGMSDLSLANVEALAGPEAYVDIICVQYFDFCDIPAIPGVDDYCYSEFPFIDTRML